MTTIDQDSPSAHEARLRKHLEKMTSTGSDRPTSQPPSLSPWPDEEAPWSTPNVFTEVTNPDNVPEVEKVERDNHRFVATDDNHAVSRVSCVEQIDVRETHSADRISRLKTDSDPPSLLGELRQRMRHQLSSTDDDLVHTKPISKKKAASPQGKPWWKLPRTVQLALSKGHRGVLISVALIAVVVGFFALSLSWPSANESVETSPIAEADHAADSTETTIVVSVAGAVANPGVVEVPEGSRVADAIEEAGGLLDDTDPGLLNLARVLNDGDLIAVEDTQPDPNEDNESSAATDTAGTVNINAADAGALVSLNGVGPVLADRIVDYREEHGSFQSVDDLLNVSGIGPAMLEKIRDEVLL